MKKKEYLPAKEAVSKLVKDNPNIKANFVRQWLFDGGYGPIPKSTVEAWVRNEKEKRKAEAVEKTTEPAPEPEPTPEPLPEPRLLSDILELEKMKETHELELKKLELLISMVSNYYQLRMLQVREDMDLRNYILRRLG